MTWSEIQLRRLKELDASPEEQNAQFDNAAERDKTFQKLGKKLIKQARLRLKEFREKKTRPQLCRIESALVETLTTNGFVQVATPIIMSKGLLAKMTIDETHPLYFKPEGSQAAEWQIPG
jgi:hypothetical protein